MRCRQPLLTMRIVHVVCAAEGRRQQGHPTHIRTDNGQAALCCSRIRRCGHQSQAILGPHILVGERSRGPVRLSIALAKIARRIRNPDTLRRLPVRATMPTAAGNGCSQARIDRPNRTKAQPARLDASSMRRPAWARTQTVRCARARCSGCGGPQHTSCLGAGPRQCREREFAARSSSLSVATLLGAGPQSAGSALAQTSPATTLSHPTERAAPPLPSKCASSSRFLEVTNLGIQMVRCLLCAR
ncbi:Uncharacterised protein [Burkholderia pseudomallei]|nr:hypothetical protein AQ15_906 [Burkholderia pseudomallei K96243]CAJ2726394.1 Uncharacterised protein [Burkholderia pseudomallei]CAJ2783153.1 Uncharacterised protein [Burkholderia pseudomallei]CAJ2829192.1 Uncharacterised protein [Burkholderia pseudomallei]CAJ2837022.1 Uncharacterised protein [Burkholderia pseudomallei]